MNITVEIAHPLGTTIVDDIVDVNGLGNQMQSTFMYPAEAVHRDGQGYVVACVCQWNLLEPVLFIIDVYAYDWVMPTWTTGENSRDLCNQLTSQPRSTATDKLNWYLS